MVKRYDPQPENCDARDTRLQLVIRQSYLNRTGSPVTILKRDGTADTIPPSNSGGVRAGRVEIRYGVNAKPEVIQEMLTSAHLSSSERRIYSALAKQGQQRQGDSALKFSVPTEELVDTEGVYIEALDIVVTMRDKANLPQHPYSASNAMVSLKGSQPPDVFTFRIAMVNKFGSVGELYVNVCGEPVCIPQANGLRVPEGIYVSRGIGIDMQTHHYSFNDDRMPFTVHGSRQDALTIGDELSNALRKLHDKEAKLEAEHNVWKKEKQEMLAERERQQYQADIDKQMLNHTLNEQERRLDYLKRQTEHDMKLKEVTVKSDADEQATVRKNSTEWLKVVPHILGTVSLAATLIKDT